MLKKITAAIILISLITACGIDFTPKPTGYFRIDLPKKEYKRYEAKDYPYAFDYPAYSEINVYNADSFWVNMSFPEFNAKIHITYLPIKNHDIGHFEQTRNLAFKHTIKADAIDEKEYFNHQHKVYGVLYNIKGNVASPINFFVSDSTKHFFRGALYFNSAPNKDSLAPVVSFLREDIIKLMETMEWNPDFVNK